MWFALASYMLATIDPSLITAQTAVAEGRYQDAAPLLDEALEHPLSAEDLPVALELRALTCAAFGQQAEAVQLFRRLLGVKPGFVLSAGQSPKVAALLENARRAGPTPPPARLVPQTTRVDGPVSAAPAPTASAPAPWTRWWFWSAVGIVAASAGVATWYAATPHIPSAKLGQLELK
jgi:tetratricopeptide (TPR) repeat protein